MRKSSSSQFLPLKQTLGWGLLFLVLVILSAPQLVGAQNTDQVDPVAHPDSTTICSRPADSYWGLIEAPVDSNTAHFKNRPRPTWEKVVMAPYYVVGVPFRLVHVVGDRTINWLDDLGIFDMPAAEYAGLPGPWNSYIMPIVGIDGLTGFTYGLSIFKPHLFGPENKAFLAAESSTKRAEKFSGGALFQLSEIWELQVGGGRKETPLTKYYGEGLYSHQGDLSYYQRIINWVGFELDRDIGKDFSLELRSYFSRVEASESKYEVQLGLGKIHAGNLPAGYPGTSSGWTTGLSIVHDGTDQDGRPDHNGFQKLGWYYFTATDGHDLRFLSYHLDVEQFLPLWFTKRTLGLRVFYNKLDNLGSEPIPLTRLVNFSNPDQLRGYESLRFYGLGSLGFSTEYRWPVWVARGREGPGLDAYLFSDVGQVFNDDEELALRHMELSGGFGLRLIGEQQSYAARLEVGFGDEGPVYRLKFSQTFQYDKKGFLYGKDPTRMH